MPAPSTPDPARRDAPEWFLRRPLFWWAAAAGAGIYAGFHLSLPPVAWLLATAAGALAALAGMRTAGVTLALAALAAGWTAQHTRAPEDPYLHDAAAVTLRGVLLRAGPGGSALLRAESRLTAGGWAPCEARIGLHGAGPARAGDRVEASGILRRPEPPTNPGGRDRRLQWLERGAFYVLEVRPLGFSVLAHGARGPLEAWAATARERVLTTNRATLSPTAAIIANEFLIGDEAPPDPGLADRLHAAFRDSGTIHLLVVSGTQVSLVAGLFLWLGWRFFRARWLWWALGAVSVAGYYLLTDGDASVTRAAVMGGAVALALVLQREPDGENCLGLAALCLFALNPLTPFDIGFQLSFAAVWSLLRLGPLLFELLGPKAVPQGLHRSALYGFHRLLAGAAAACIAAQLGTAPLLAFHFQRSSWGGIVANVPAVFAATWLMPAVTLHALLSLAGIPALAPAVEWLSGQLYGLALYFGRPPFGAADVFPTPEWLLPTAFALVGLPSLGGRSRGKTLGAVLGLAALLLVSERLPAPPPQQPALRAIDVGQGDALLLQGADGTNLLVDAGPPEAAADLTRALRALRVARLDAALASHGDADHIGGLRAVLEQVPTGLLLHHIPAGGPLWQETLQAAHRRRVRVVQPAAGDRLVFGRSALTVLGPLAGAASENDASLVLRWDSDGARALLPGDAGFPAEERLRAWGPELAAEVLKVGHHGSATSTGEPWLRAVHPRLALISCGRDNRFGHPAPAALERLRAAGVAVARTDRAGMVTVRWGERGPRAEGFLAR